MRRLLVIASLLALGGCTDGALDATSPMAMVRQLASANTDDDCVAKALEWGDKDPTRRSPARSSWTSR